ncbi:MAG: alpha/beta fold hydrolase [Myxococcota bacterium]
MAPRPFERPATIALPDTPGLPAGASLEGLWLPARSAAIAGTEAIGGERTEATGIAGDARGGAIIAAPHPQMGGSMDSPVVTELGLAASDAGLVSLRFNWRGIGGSAGRPSGETADADADCLAALDFMRESVEGPIVACGYSWGALAVFRTCAAAPRVKRLVLVAPPPAMLDRAALERSGRPMLIVAGDRDTYVPLDALEQCVAGLERVELAILPGVDHFFMTGLGELGRRVRSWLGAAS